MRRRILAALFVAAAVPVTAAAQTVESGIKGGITLATVPEIAQALDFDSSTSDYRAGVAAGVFVAFEATDWFAVQPELLYVQKGVDVDILSPIPESRRRLETDYLEIPVLARLSGGSDVLEAYVFGGPTFGIRLGAKVVTEVGSTTTSRDAGDEIKKTEVGVAVGGGVKFSFLLVEARLTEGLTAINKAGADLGQDVKNRTFSVMGGIVF